MTPTLIEAARAAESALNNLIDAQNDPPLVRHAASWLCAMNGAIASMQALRAAIDAAEKVEPAAYRVECKWRDPARDQAWRKYADYWTRKAAELSQQGFADPGDIQSRVVPLYAGEPEEPR